MARIHGQVLAFAQDRRYFAWLLTGPLNELGSGNVGVVGIKDLRTGRIERLPEHPHSAGVWFSLDLDGLALSVGRVFWGQTYRSFNTLDAQLGSASLSDRRLRGVCCQEVDRSMPLDRLLPPVGDGTNVYFWEGTENDFLGPIVRLLGLKRRRVTGRLSVPVALGAGGGRFAVASRIHDDANSPAWSPDGKQIAYLQHGSELWLSMPTAPLRTRSLRKVTIPTGLPTGHSSPTAVRATPS